MKLIIELKDETYKFYKENALILIARGNGRILASEVYEAIKNGTPYNPSGDCISREALKEVISKVVAEERKEDERWAAGLRYALTLIDNAQAVEINEQTIKDAYEQGYADGRKERYGEPDGRPQGEWIEYNATGKKQYMCSKCSMKEKNPKIARYCYWCGAKMKGGAKNES